MTSVINQFCEDCADLFIKNTYLNHADAPTKILLRNALSYNLKAFTYNVSTVLGIIGVAGAIFGALYPATVLTLAALSLCGRDIMQVAIDKSMTSSGLDKASALYKKFKGLFIKSDNPFESLFKKPIFLNEIFSPVVNEFRG